MALIAPEVFKNIRRIQIQTTHIVNELLAGVYHSAFKGSGIEFEEVREYQPGDDERSIDWNVTARMNHPYVKNYREERELTVMLVVDISASSRFGSSERFKNELVAEIGAVLAFSAIKNNDKVGLLLFSDQVEKYLPPKKGVRHVLRVIRELLVFKPQHVGTHLTPALQFLGKVQKKSGICFLISDFMGPDYSKAITPIAAKHDLITIAMVDTYEKQLPNLGIVTFSDLETNEEISIDTSNPRAVELFFQYNNDRLATHKKLMDRIGAGFIPLQTDRAYVDALRTFLQERKKRAL